MKNDINTDVGGMYIFSDICTLYDHIGPTGI